VTSFKQFLNEAIPSTRLGAASDKDKMRARLAKTFAVKLPEMEKYFTNATPRNFKTKYNAFVMAFPDEAKKIDSYRPDGVGPGELIAYFVFNDISIGGGQSNIDLFKNGEPFAEVKAGDPAHGGIQDFKLDTEHSKSSKRLLKSLDDFNTEYKKLTDEDLPGWNGASEANATALRHWRKVNLVDFGGDDESVEDIADDWVASVKDAYVKNKNFMLVNRKTLRIHYFGQLGIEMMDLLRTTRGQPKAAVNA
jgi:hypothetical protein